LAIIPRWSLDFKIIVKKENVPHREFTRLFNCDEI